MSTSRRRWLQFAAVATPVAATTAPAAAATPAKAERMPGDPPEHRVVYQFNQADPGYMEHILNSVGALIGKYEDNVAIAVVAFGPGIHLLAKRPGRPVPKALRERAASQARDYGVRFVACGNTMKTLGWTDKDIVEFAKIEEVGAAALMEMQEQGWAYIAW
jgi:intracellular sulfur oxidation DsrE/DsrF family protein